MTQLDIKQLKAEARGRVATAPQTRTLVLIYCGVLAVLALSSSALSFYLDSQISGTGGLSGLGLRSVLQTVQTVLNYVNTFFGPFWQAGFLFCIIGVVRGGQVAPKHLGEGFRRFGRILAYTINSALITLFLALVSVYAASFLFSLSPWGMDFAEAMGPALMDPELFTAEGAINMDLVPMEAVMVALPPLAVMFAVVFIPLQLYVNYALRMGQFLLMAGGPMSGMGAMLLSRRMTRGYRMAFLKLDLSYWWYYVLLFLATMVGYLDALLPLLGIPLSLDPLVLYFVTMGLYLVADLAISLWKKCEIDAASVLICESILSAQTPAQTLQPTPVDPE